MKKLSGALVILFILGQRGLAEEPSREELEALSPQVQSAELLEEPAVQERILSAPSEFSKKSTIKTVEVKGNQRVDQQGILDYFQRNPNHLYSSEDLNAYLKTLFHTGLFADVRLDVMGETLRVTVKENRVLNQIVFEGNKEIPYDDLKTVVSLKPRQIFTLARVRENEQNILNLYRTRGLYATCVSPEIIQRDFNRVDLIFKIKEGPKAKIGVINFVGNEKFSDELLSGVISSLEARWYRLFSPPEETYNAERVKYDGELLKQFYLKNGYLDFALTSSSSELTEDHKHFVLTFTLSEGKRYRVGDIKIRSDVPNVTCEKLRALMDWGTGSWFNGKALQATCDSMGIALGEEGVPFVEVVPVTIKKGNCIDIEFVVQRIPPQYVGKLSIEGHFSTDDAVIRRELTFAEGDPVNPAKLSESEERLRDLDFFEQVEIIDRPGKQGDQRDFTVKVKEKGTGDIQFSGGYTSTLGATAKIGLSERNWLGQGNDVHLDAYLASQGLDINTGVQKPYFMGRDITVGCDLSFMRFRGRTHEGKRSKDNSYLQQVGGATFNASYKLSKNLYQSWNYRVRRDFLSLTRVLSPYILENMRGHRLEWVSALGHNLVYDRTERTGGEVTGGWFAKLSTDFSGMGGGIKYIANALATSQYISFDDEGRFLLRLDTRAGIISKCGYMRFMDQYALGGFSFPGFAENGIGPRDQLTEDALQGRRYYSTSGKFFFPLGFPKELPIKGVVFAQMGSLWDSIFRGKKAIVIKENGKDKQFSTSVLGNTFSNRVAIGAGILCTLPLVGRLGVVFSKALKKQNYDYLQSVMFIWGQEF
jgi:outer membrane protein insertion porin family